MPEEFDGTNSENCEKCAGFCCVALEIPKSSAGTLTKTANKVCEFLDLSPAGTGHRCSTYGSRKEKGFETCLHYRCHGAGPLVTAEAIHSEWIRSDGTFEPEAVKFYEAAYRINGYLDLEDSLRAAQFFPFFQKKPTEFESACRKIRETLEKEGRLTDEHGNDADPEAVIEWFFRNVKRPERGIFGFLFPRKDPQED